jgi:DNA-binding response OmpR family regulator
MKKILAVDDEKDVLLMLEKRLTAKGYSVITTTNGTNAIALAKSQHPDIIILDMLLPDIHAGEVAAILKDEAQTKDIPIIFLSGLFSKAEEAKKGHLISGQTMFAKPYDIEELQNAIEELTQEKKTFLKNKKQPSRDIKILIVDDEKDFLRILGSRLKASGYDVAFAMDGISAIAAAKEEKPDLIILDIGLPAGDGFYVMHQLSVIAQTVLIPVIMVTGQDDSDAKKRSLEAGARAFLQKPVDKDGLLDVIGKVLADQKEY